MLVEGIKCTPCTSMSFQLFPYYCLVVLILDRCGRKTKEGKTGSCAFINRSFTSLTSLLWDGLEDGVISCDGPGLRLCSDVKRKAGKENISYDLYTMQLRPEGSKNRRETKGKCPSPHSTKKKKVTSAPTLLEKNLRINTAVFAISTEWKIRKKYQGNFRSFVET